MTLDRKGLKAGDISKVSEVSLDSAAIKKRLKTNLHRKDFVHSFLKCLKSKISKTKLEHVTTAMKNLTTQVMQSLFVLKNFEKI